MGKRKKGRWKKTKKQDKEPTPPSTSNRTQRRNQARRQSRIRRNVPEKLLQLISLTSTSGRELIKTQKPDHVVWMTRPFHIRTYQKNPRSKKRLHLFQGHFLRRVFKPEEHILPLQKLLDTRPSYWKSRRDRVREPRQAQLHMRVDLCAGKIRFSPRILAKLGESRTLRRRKMKRKVEKIFKRQRVEFGVWMEQGHAKFGGKVHYVKSKAFFEAGNQIPKEFLDAIQPIAKIASELLKVHRYDLWKLIQDLQDPETFLFGGCFHLFMASKGVTRYHVDQTNTLAFLFPIKLLHEGAGGLEIYLKENVTVGCSWKVGDCSFIDARNLVHGTGTYDFVHDDRVIGMLIIQSSIFTRYAKNKAVLTLRDKTLEDYFQDRCQNMKTISQ